MFVGQRISRRGFFASSLGTALGTVLLAPGRLEAAPRLRVTAVELLPVRVTSRTVWLIVRLQTDAGLVGLGEASDAFGYANTTREQASRMASEIADLFVLVKGRSPLAIGAFREQAASRVARGGLVTATAFSALEQALWDLTGKALDVPTYALFGGKLRDALPVYANVNRATTTRTPDGFAASARAALRDGFRAVKGAPFDGFPPSGSPQSAIDAAVENGIACMVAMREAIGPDAQLMVDCHSFFDVDLAERVARRLEPQNLTWYEEPVAPERTQETREIRRRITQDMAGGEILYGVAGFASLIRDRTVNVIMPDVKHCGGLLELTHIAAAAKNEGVRVAPHNPSGPVSTAASVQVSAVIENFQLLEFQWGESPWRHELVVPSEHFVNGAIQVPSRPGLGIALNEPLVRRYRM
ncbi:MAG: mandelate racemase/muconate lactonizing enzyme family protein [Gemmatimonadota bacterium]